MKPRYALISLLCILLASSALGAVYTASDSPGPGEFATVQAAVNMCGPTDSVEVIGSFAETINVFGLPDGSGNNITIFNGGGASIVEPATPSNFGIINIGDGSPGSGDGVTIDGLELSYGQYYDAIDILSNNVTIKNCHIHANFIGAENWGIVFSGGFGCVTSDNCFYDNTAFHMTDWNGTPLANTYSGNSFEDFQTNPGYGAGEYWIAGGAQKDFSPAAATITPTAPAELLYGSEVAYPLEFAFDAPCQGLRGAKVIEFDVLWNPAKLDYVGYADGDGMPGTGQYLINDDDVATGKLVVTAASLDDEMFDDGNLGFVSFDVIGVPSTYNTVVNANVSTACLAFSSAGDTIPMVPVTGVYVPIVDNGDPTIAYTLSDGCEIDTYRLISDIDILTCDVTDDVDLYAAWYQINGLGWVAFSDLLNTGTPPPFVTSDALDAPVTIPYVYLPTGDHSLFFRVDDHFGNSTVVEYEFKIDRTAPVLDVFTLEDWDGCADAGYTSKEVRARTTNADGTADKIMFHYYQGGDGWTETAWMNYGTSRKIDLDGMMDNTSTAPDDGLYHFQVKVKDLCGNESGWTDMGTPTIALDQTDCPSIAFDITPTSGTSLTVAYTASDGCAPPTGNFWKFLVTEDPDEINDCGSANWAAWPPSGSFTFTDADCGVYTAYFALMDDAGNMTYLEDTYAYDDCAPVVTAVSVADQSDPPTVCTNSWVVDVTVEYTQDTFDTNPFYVRFSLDGGTTWGPGWASFAGLGETSFDFAVNMSAYTGAVANGVNDIIAQVSDHLGNWSNVDQFGSIYMNNDDPSFTDARLRDFDYPADGDGTPVHAQWSNEGSVFVVVTGVVELGDFDFVVSEDATFATGVTTVNVDDAADLTGGDYQFAYTFDPAPADGDTRGLHIKIVDCSGRESVAPNDPDFDDIDFDFMSRDAASIDAFDAVAATVNYLTPVVFNLSASDAVSAVMSMKIYEAGYQSLTTWEAASVNPSVTLQDLGDGERTVRIKVADMAGNTTGYVEATVIVDTDAPAGSFELVSMNPDSYAGEPHAYTNQQDCKLIIAVPADAIAMHARNHNPNVGYVSIPIVTAGESQDEDNWDITYNAQDFDWVQVRFMDAALNWSDWIKDSIMVDLGAPPAFVAMADEGVYFGDGTDCGVWWDNDYADHYYSTAYYLRWGDYPVYEGAVPPQPTSLTGTGFSLGAIPPEYNAFLQTDDPTEDIYNFSIYNVDSAGNATINTPGMAISQSYIVGDLDFDGKVSFIESEARGDGDFLRFSDAYYALDNQMPADPHWDDACDFSDNLDTYFWPEPDDAIDIYDLFDFVISYTNYHEGVGSRGSEQFFAVAMDPGGAKFAPTHAPVAIMAELPDRLAIGEEVTITFNLDDPSGIMGLHMIFDPSDNLEIVKVEKGEMFNTSDKTFFYKDINNGSLLIDGVIFSENGFANQEIAQVTFQAKANISTFTLNDVEMLVRDANNQAVEAVFNTTVEKTVALPTEFSLGQNYPNPFNPSTTIKLALPVASHYALDIYNIAGQKVESFSGYSEAGIVNVIWDATNAASGVYFYKVSAGTFEATKKMVLIK